MFRGLALFKGWKCYTNACKGCSTAEWLAPAAMSPWVHMWDRVLLFFPVKLEWSCPQPLIHQVSSTNPKAGCRRPTALNLPQCLWRSLSPASPHTLWPGDDLVGVWGNAFPHSTGISSDICACITVAFVADLQHILDSLTGQAKKTLE